MATSEPSRFQRIRDSDIAWSFRHSPVTIVRAPAMPPKITDTVLIEISHLETTDILASAKKFNLKGYLIDRNKEIQLLVSYDPVQIYRFFLTLGRYHKTVHLSEAVFTELPPIQELTVTPLPVDDIRISMIPHLSAPTPPLPEPIVSLRNRFLAVLNIFKPNSNPPQLKVEKEQSSPILARLDTVDTLGRLIGWALPSSNRYASVQLYIDGKLAVQGTANIFRLDLLESGLGLGVHGFRLRPPDEFLDGKSHEVKLEVPESGVSDSRTMSLPFHFNHPRPWVSEDIPSSSSIQKDEKHFQALRSEIINGNNNSSHAKIRKLIERKPSMLFRDLGFEERHARSSRRMPSFKERLDDRWMTLYGPELCGDKNCCKREPLRYNSKLNLRLRERTHDNLLSKCPLKIRHFASKSLMKEYAESFGVRLPKIYNVLNNLEEFDNFDFPSRYVMKPDTDSGAGLFLMHHGINLFDGFPCNREMIREKLENYLERKPGSQFIVEEFIVQEGTEQSYEYVPLDYKLHAFGGKVRIIQVDDRNTVSRDPLHRRQSWFSRDWVAAPFRMRKKEEENDPIQPPVCLNEMLGIADTMASDIGEYIRIDMYASNNGPVLGELTTYSHSGLGFTEYGSTILSQAWELYEGTDHPRPRIERSVRG